MRQRMLGATGVLVSELALGTMTFGKETDEPAAQGILDRYVDAGGNFIDTADVYQAGAAEEIIGRWLGGRGARDRLVIATKARFPMGADANEAGLSRRWLHRALDDSLRRLGVDHVDLFQAHCWDPLTPLEETLETFDALVRSGKVRYVGVSNFAGWQLQRAVLLARTGGLAPVVTLQPQYNLLAREIEWELVPLCLDEGIGLLPWSPLGGGWLTGKYTRGAAPEGASRLGEDPGRGLEAWARRDRERTWRVVEAVREIADARGCSPAQVALRWVTDRPGVCATILGVRNLEQLADNLGAGGWRLDPDEAAGLDAVSEPPMPDYPYGFLRSFSADRLDGVG